MVCPDHVQFTQHGRRLCGPCMEDRNIRRREKLAEKGKSLDGELGSDLVAFAASGDFEPEWLKEAGGKQADFAVLQAEAAAHREKVVDEYIEAKLDDDEGGTDLILKRSGYQPPSKAALTAAFLFFGFAGLLVYRQVPMLQEAVWPFESTAIEYTEDMMPIIQDTNRLRNTTNMQSMNLFYEVPLFLLVWTFIIGYAGGVIILGYAMVTSIYRFLYDRLWRDREA